jgi:chromosome segregation ATPase
VCFDCDVITILLTAVLVSGGTTYAQPRQGADLRRELAELDRTREDLEREAQRSESARGTVEMAARAIAEARTHLRQNQRARAERASQIAAAALALAAKQIALESTRARLREAERRASLVTEQAEEARRALEAALVRRAESAQQPIAPPAPAEEPSEGGGD